MLSFLPCSTGILRHLTVVHTSSLFGQKPAPRVNIEKLQEDAEKVKKSNTRLRDGNAGGFFMLKLLTNNHF